MISKAKIKYLNSLAHKKFRDADNVFIAEGERLVDDLLNCFEPKIVATNTDWIAQNRARLSNSQCEIIEVTDEEMRRITQLSTPSPVFCVFRRDEVATLDEVRKNGGLVLALDRVQDPGNIGTIIRTADWFGVIYILCSHETADIYNPKVIQSTMGAIGRVDVIYCDLVEVLASLKQEGWSVNGTFLDGGNIYQSELRNEKSVVVMGNEGNGISDEVKKLVNNRLLIPSYPAGEITSESMNVAIATAIVLAEYRRRV